jgi:hypothetical protein
VKRIAPVAFLAAAAGLMACRSRQPPPAPALAPEPAPVAAAPYPTLPPLPDEAPEPLTPDPSRGEVTIKLVGDGNRKAHVLWGRKDFGQVPLEIRRPRGSGPMDLVVVAPGTLPLHTRVFTDRDETLSLRLYDEDGAHGLLGYTRSFSLPTSSGFTQNAGTFRRSRR